MPLYKNTSFMYEVVHLAPEEQIGLHRDPSWELSYIILGEGMKQIGNVSEPFKAHEVVFIPPEIPHCWKFSDSHTDAEGKISNITIVFDEKFLNNCTKSFPELRDSIEALKTKRDAVTFTADKADAIIATMNEMRTMSAAERIAPMLKLLLIIAKDGEERIIGRYEETPKTKERLRQIQIYVMCNAKRCFSIDDVAKHVGMNRVSFCIFFKKHTGKTFVTYLNEFRIEKACKYLKDFDMPISEIAYNAGFNDIPYFNRVFKRLKGISPGRYRDKFLAAAHLPPSMSSVSEEM